MPIRIKNAEAVALVKEISALTGEGPTALLLRLLRQRTRELDVSAAARGRSGSGART